MNPIKMLFSKARFLRIAFLVMLTFGLGLSSGWAQQVEITPLIGYQFGGKVTVQRGTLNIKDSMNYGVILDITVRPNTQLELSYSRQDTRVEVRGVNIDNPIHDATVEYWQIGGLVEYPKDRVRPFGLFTLGATHFNPKTAGVSSVWRFSGTIGGGVKVFLSPNIGLRLQGRILLPYLSGGSSFFCGLPGGCYVTLGGTVLLQADVTAGLILAF
jgi:opacity protein-like surface antigen